MVESLPRVVLLPSVAVFGRVVLGKRERAARQEVRGARCRADWT